MIALIIGANGQDGRFLKEYLTNINYEVIEIDIVATTVTAEVDDFATGSATAGVGYSTSSSTAPVGSTYTTS